MLHVSPESEGGMLREAAGMVSGMGSALSGLAAHAKLVDATSNNVANVNTKGFKKTRVTMEEGPAQAVKPTLRRVDTPGPLVYRQTHEGGVLEELSNVELAQEMTNLILGERGVEANVKTIQTQDEMLGTLMDMLG